MRKLKSQPATAGALVIPFPRFSRPRHRKVTASVTTPEFDAGFEFAMLMVKGLKSRGLLNCLKGA